MVRAALERQRARASARLKVRMCRDLYERAGVCAAEVGETVGRWMGLCLLPANAGKRIGGVALPDGWEVATRGGTVATVECPAGTRPEAVREAVARAVLWMEARRLPPVACDLREGVDYYVERGE